MTLLGLEALLSYAVVRGLAVGSRLAAGDVGEGEKEVVDVVVARVVGRAGFADEVGDLVEELGAEVGVFGLVGDYVDVTFWAKFRERGRTRGSTHRYG